MTETTPKRHTALADLVERKKEGRRDLAKLSFGEKIARIQVMRERLLPLKCARERRKPLSREGQT